ncbi:MAG: WSC domain-containing protein [Pyrinomonadaceae bacterium]
MNSGAAPGNRTVTINWRNTFGFSGKETFTITVLRNPVVSSVTPTTVTSGRTTELTISGSDLGAAKISLAASATSMPITSNTETRMVVSGTWPTIFRQKTDILRIRQQASVLLSVKAADIVILPDPEVATFLGCYVDTPARVLNGYSFSSTTGMTNQVCQQKCKTQGFKYAGTEYASQCFCGNTAPTQVVGSQECGMSCSGAPGEKCGGTWRLSVYRWPADIAPSDASTSIPSITVFNLSPGGGTSNATGMSINATVIVPVVNPGYAIPTLSEVQPSSAKACAAFTLTVKGTGFYPVSKVRWNGGERPTTYVSSTELTATISAAAVAAAGSANVTVLTPSPGGGTTAARSLTIQYGIPTITSVSPASVNAGGQSFTLTIVGAGFCSVSKVRWNGSDRPTTRSGNDLRATIPVADIAAGGNAQVTVFNPTPVGGTSVAKTVAINNPVPVTTSLEPASTQFGGSSFTLTVNGANFVPSSRVHWNGSDRPTTFVSSTKLTATISAQDIERNSPPKNRTAAVTVYTPPPIGDASSVLTFSITKQE